MQLLYIQNDAITLGLLLGALSLVFVTSRSENRFLKGFYRIFPPLLLCYVLPALMHWPLGWISGETSGLYKIASRYLLPASLVMLCLSIDLKSIAALGSKALIMFLTATLGIILGGPVALLTVTYLFPGLITAPPDEVWRGLSTIAGSWIGGGANQTAMKEVFNVPDDLFGSMVVIDVIVANIWMAFLLYGAGITSRIDRWLKADSTAITMLVEKVQQFRASVERIPRTSDLILLMGICFGVVALSHAGADTIVPAMAPYKQRLMGMGLDTLADGFFWIIVIATTLGLLLSFTPAKKLEGVGASTWGSVFIYMLVATIGMKMNLGEIFNNMGLFLVGLIWMLTHALLLLIVAKIIRAPFFFVAVGSQANVGGAASAPVVASAFDPALAPVGVLLAVLGYALGTYGGLIAAWLMRLVIGA